MALKKVSTTARAQHGRRVRVAGHPGFRAAAVRIYARRGQRIASHRDAEYVIAWVSPSQARKLRDALDKFLGDRC